MMQGLVSADALHSGIRWKSLELGKMNSHVGFSNFYVCAAERIVPTSHSLQAWLESSYLFFTQPLNCCQKHRAPCHDHQGKKLHFLYKVSKG
jgi:hypothetical protein